MQATIYHNPRCGKSRQTLALLRAHGIEPIIIDYLKTPPDASTLADILHKLGLEPRGLMRKKQAEYTVHKLDDPDLNRQALLDAMVACPILIERPIVLVGDKAVIGRPPEAILPLLEAEVAE